MQVLELFTHARLTMPKQSGFRAVCDLLRRQWAAAVSWGADYEYLLTAKPKGNGTTGTDGPFKYSVHVPQLSYRKLSRAWVEYEKFKAKVRTCKAHGLGDLSLPCDCAACFEGIQAPTFDMCFKTQQLESAAKQEEFVQVGSL